MIEKHEFLLIQYTYLGVGHVSYSRVTLELLSKLDDENPHRQL